MGRYPEGEPEKKEIRGDRRRRFADLFLPSGKPFFENCEIRRLFGKLQSLDIIFHRLLKVLNKILKKLLFFAQICDVT